MKERLLESVVQEMEQGVVILDENGVILYANPFFEKTFAINRSLQGTKFADVIADRPLLTTVNSILSSENKIPQEVTIQVKENQVLELRLVPFSREGLKGVIVFFQDVTEEKKVEAIKRDFVANVSHELRTPLASIKGYTETLLDGGMEDRTVSKKFLDIIDRHANRMTALIDDLLTLSMLESHQMPVKFEPLDIRGLILGVVHGIEEQAKDKGIDLSVDFQPEDLLMVKGDRVSLEQVIVNLVDNAIKYTNKGSVQISARSLNQVIQIDIRDTGIGIPEKDLTRIFERFYRVDKGRSRELGGTGLGLAIVKHIIQGHNGKIQVNSKVGSGTTFSLQLPSNPL